ncbi:MAG: glycogen synthase GlgA [Candidatus Omnitrophota bacterium]|jgi:starch synthase
MKILIVASEVFPFAKVGGLADMTGSLAKALCALGCEARVVMPLYKCVDTEKFPLKKEKTGIRHPLTGRFSGFDLYSHKADGAVFYFIGKKKYFSREEIYGASGGDYPDNAYRFAFLSKAALILLKTLGFKPDAIHCNDWQTALIPLYLKHQFAADDFYAGIKTLFTVHNMAYQGVFSKRVMRGANIPEDLFTGDRLEFYGKLNFMKSGLIYADAISTVSRRYAREIMTPEYGCGLEELVNSRKEDLHGILNGVDYDTWSPEKDKVIKENFSADSLDKKENCKKDLLEYTKLAVSLKTPLLGCVTRLVEQKGMDLVANIMDRIVREDAGMVILGRGSKRYNKMFADLERKYPGRLYVCSDFNDELAHKIEAGCDMFVMPSRYEPCGLNQMYSIKYGTIPVVRATGGLDDAIVDFDEDKEKGNGFKFKEANEDALFDAIKRALSSFKDKTAWRKLMTQAMSYDHSWEHSAKEYIELYKKIKEKQ